MFSSEIFLLITSKIESFAIRNFVAFGIILNVELGQNKRFSKFASWVKWHDHIW